MVMSFNFDTTSLPPEEADELVNLVNAADFFELPTTISTDAQVVDQFQYMITVEREEKQHTIEISDAAIPENLWPLLNKLRILSRTSRNT
jgi:hypothetical protein